MKLLLLIICFSAFFCDAFALVSDGVTLLSLLRHWTFVPPPINSSWKDSDSTPCSWVGVQCDHDHNVVSLNLTSHGISGRLGPEIGQLHQLQTLVLLNNSFSGKMPSELRNCSLLVHLDLSQNHFSGKIPSELGMLSELEDLELSFNRLTGEIPVSIWRIQSLREILVYGNALSGELPSEMTELKHLRNISLFDNQFSGVIPESLGINSSLVKLDFAYNKFTGNIPPNLCFGKQLSVLDMGGNYLQGGIPSDVGRCATLRRLVLAENNFTGSLPKFESNPNLIYMDIDKNNISGAIPSSLENCRNLASLILSMNKFTGFLPPELGKLGNLVRLNLSHNNLEGPLPPQLSSCSKMDYFDVGFNVLNGSFPSSFRSWTELSTLILRENHFTGGIPGFLSEFVYLSELQLGGNMFGGEIPRSMGALQNLLYGLNLSANGLIGKIPSEIGKLKMLQNLDVSLNSLTGSIGFFDELLSLIEVNISFNSFNGPIPEKLMKLLNSSPSSFMGNPDLCVSCSPSDGVSCTETNYLKPCPKIFSAHKKRTSKFTILIIEIGSSIFVFTVLLLLIHMYLLRRSKQEVYSSDEEEASSSFFDRRGREHIGQVNKKEVKICSEQELSFLRRQVMKVTDNLSDQYIIGGGAHGIVYKAQLSPYRVIAVKKLEFSRNRGKSLHKLRESMHREIQTVGMIKHPNLVRYMDHWFGKDYGVILYKFMDNGSLHDVLHEMIPPPSLNWNVRLKIAIGIARGLAYLHYDCHPPILHRDIKSKNILLGSDMEPLITDFGTALLKEQQYEHSGSPSQTRLSACIAGTIGYIDPVIAYMVLPSRKSDVYSYGVVLLELLTRKKALDPSFLEQTTLVRWVRSVLVKTHKIEAIVDACLASEFAKPMVAAEVTAVLWLALRCTDREPRLRPTMRDIIEFYRKGTMLKLWNWEDNVDYNPFIDDYEAPKRYNFPNLIPEAPESNISSVPAPAINTWDLSEKVSQSGQTTDSLQDKERKFKCNISWSFPLEGWVKVNTHGCQAGCGGIIRGDSGEWLRGFSVNLQESCSNLTATEFWGLYHGLLMAWDLVFRRVILETDSLTAVQQLIHIPATANKVNKLQLCANPIALCRELIQRDWQVKVQLISKEGNFCAYWLANSSFRHHIGKVVYLTPPVGLVDFLNLDVSGSARLTHIFCNGLN